MCEFGHTRKHTEKMYIQLKPNDEHFLFVLLEFLCSNNYSTYM